MGKPSDHPPETLLLDFAAQSLPPDSREDIGSHVASCESCQSFLSALGEATSPGRISVSDVDPSRTSDRLMGSLVGEYRILERLGQGGMGVVYRAEHALIGKPAAVKVLLGSIAGDPSFGHRMLAEARAVNDVRHPNIVDIFAFGQLPDGRPYLVMELLSGKSLADVLFDQHSLSPERTMQVLGEALDALAAAHAAGVVHRDLKPDNIFIDPKAASWKVKLVDFGLAKRQRAVDAKLTRPGALMGTPGYMAPEQVRDSEAVSPKTDVYALGVVAWTMLAGREPFAGGSPVEVMHRHITTPAPALPAEAGVPPRLAALIKRMLAKDPDRRPTAEEARAELEEITQAPDAEPGPARGDAPPRRFALWAGAAALVVAAVIGVVSFELLKPDEVVIPGPEPIRVATPQPRAQEVVPAKAEQQVAEAVVPPPAPAPKRYVPPTGVTWPCKNVMRVSPIMKNVEGTWLLFTLSIHGEDQVLVSANIKEGGRKSLERLRARVERCRESTDLLWAERIRMHPYGMWVDSKEEGMRQERGWDVVAADLKIIPPDGPLEAAANRGQ